MPPKKNKKKNNDDFDDYAFGEAEASAVTAEVEDPNQDESSRAIGHAPGRHVE